MQWPPPNPNDTSTTTANILWESYPRVEVRTVRFGRYTGPVMPQPGSRQNPTDPTRKKTKLETTPVPSKPNS